MSLQEKVEQLLQKRGMIYQSRDGEIVTQYIDPEGNPVVAYRICIVNNQLHILQQGRTPLVFTDVGMFSYWLDI